MLSRLRMISKMYKICIITATLWLSFGVLGQTNPIRLTGSAKKSDKIGNTVNLVDSDFQDGGAWYPNTFNLEDSFFVDITVDFHDFSSEGFTIVLQNNSLNPLGVGGVSLGVPSSGDVFVLEFDLVQNVGNIQDARVPHTSYFKGLPLEHIGTNLLRDVVLSPILKKVEDLRIIWVPGNPINGDKTVGSFSVKREGCTISNLAYTGNLQDSVFNGQKEVYMGFTASTSNNADTISVTFNDNSNDLSRTITICEGQKVDLSLVDNAALIWADQTALDQGIQEEPVDFIPNETGFYAVQHSNACGVYIDSILVTVIDSVMINPEIEYDVISYSTNLKIDVTPQEYEIVWTLPDSSQSNEATLIDAVPGPYQVSVKDTYGCVSTGKINVELSSGFGTETIDASFTPNSIANSTTGDVFTPNGDGEDELILIHVPGASVIVNQYGEKLKEVFYGDSWDGKNQHGLVMPSGVYLVIGETNVQKITLLR